MPDDPLATTEELTVRLGGTLSAVEETRADAALADASALVRDEGDPDWTEDDVPARVHSIVLQAARRAFRNPEGYSQSSIGDVSVSYSRSGAQGAVYLTRPEHRAVRRAAGRHMMATTLADPYQPPPRRPL